LRYIDPSGHDYCDSIHADPEECAEIDQDGDGKTDPPTFPNSMPTDLTGDGPKAYDSISYLRSFSGAWWGDDLSAQELIAILLFLEASVGFNNNGGNWFMNSDVVEAMTHKYNQFCGSGAWSSRCFSGFLAYYEPILTLLTPQSKIDDILKYDLYNMEPGGEVYITTAQSVMNNPGIGGQTGNTPTGWVTLNSTKNLDTFKLVLAMINNQSYPFYYYLYPGNEKVFIVLSINLATSICGSPNCVNSP